VISSGVYVEKTRESEESEEKGKGAVGNFPDDRRAVSDEGSTRE